MEKYAVEIERAFNGYILTDLSGERDKTVIEESEEEFSEIKAGKNLLFAIMNHFNLSGSKHDKLRLKVILEKQGGDDA